MAIPHVLLTPLMARVGEEGDLTWEHISGASVIDEIVSVPWGSNCCVRNLRMASNCSPSTGLNCQCSGFKLAPTQECEEWKLNTYRNL